MHIPRCLVDRVWLKASIVHLLLSSPHAYRVWILPSWFACIYCELATCVNTVGSRGSGMGTEFNMFTDRYICVLNSGTRLDFESHMMCGWQIERRFTCMCTNMTMCFV